jgi:hypothetical protein
MVLRLLEYSIYNTSTSIIQVKFELNNKEKSAYFDRVKFSIILNSVKTNRPENLVVRKNPLGNLTRPRVRV